MFWDNNGLLNSKFDEQDSFNSFLFTLEYYFLSNEEKRKELRGVLDYAIRACKVSEGIYKATPTDTFLNVEQSHDNLTALSAYSYVRGLSTHEEIWDEILDQKFRYNNVTPDSPGLRLLHPRDIIYYGILNGDPICWLLFPIFCIISLCTCFGKATSGKLLFFVRCHAMEHNIFFNILYYIASLLMFTVSPYKNWAEVFEVYFSPKDHPIRELLDQLRE